jgi:hypothetical protein
MFIVALSVLILFKGNNIMSKFKIISFENKIRFTDIIAAIDEKAAMNAFSALYPCAKVLSIETL